MKLLKKMKDGGPKSKVWGYWLVEIKSLFSIVLLRFENGSRDAYHSHAFNSASWLISGQLYEMLFDGSGKTYRPSWRPIITQRTTTHRVLSNGRSWVLSFRGPWAPTWMEYLPRTEQTVTLTHGRRIVGVA